MILIRQDAVRSDRHFKLSMAIAPRTFKVDFDNDQKRIKASFDGPIAVLVGPGAASTGDFSAEWLSAYPRVRTFGKSTATAFDLPSQPALGSTLDLGPGWEARIAEANAFEVGDPQHYSPTASSPSTSPSGWRPPMSPPDGTPLSRRRSAGSPPKSGHELP